MRAPNWTDADAVNGLNKSTAALRNRPSVIAARAGPSSFCQSACVVFLLLDKTSYWFPDDPSWQAWGVSGELSGHVVRIASIASASRWSIVRL